MDRAVPFGRDRHARHGALRHPPDLHGCRQGRGRGAGLTLDEVPFQITQRADFFEEEVGLETTLKRPIVNTRDEPHCDAQKYRRLHVIVGDANLSEVATFLKVGTTAIVLSMIEDDVLPGDFVFGAPVWAMRQVSLRPVAAPTARAGRRPTITALDVQWELYDRARKYGGSSASRLVGEASATKCCAGGKRCSPRSRPTR